MCEIVGDAPLYVTFDVDGLGPVQCPGTGPPEPGGLSMRESPTKRMRSCYRANSPLMIAYAR